MAGFRKRLAVSFLALRRSLERRRGLIVAIQHDPADFDVCFKLQQEILEEDEDAEETENAPGSYCPL
ncbi:hypothetical protein NKDENANG_03507 [Candidatus Entotheonellaceae bacterium PAL068K]